MTFFAEELRKCLNAAGLSDCGENDCWNYWYERIMASFNEAVDRATRTEQAENAKLREMLAKARDPQRIGGTADPESFVYAIEQLREFRWQHATNDEDAIPYINNVVAAHERENAKLRETLRVLMMGTNAEMCADRDEADCTMCSMHHGKDGCTVVDAMELLGIDMYGMPLGVGVDG